ncbi:MAG: SAM-dependent methyltransferase [Chitinophagaceae bacterium]|jgi:16S rRNA (cytidine1402-2'-O)-methyltransferase|nr:SAM-dependent methyltransferase [Chitinophagaceae bacterium]
MSTGQVYLIPSLLHDDGLAALPVPYLVEAVKQCQVFFVENERTARRFLKRIWKEMPIDDFGWYTIHKAEPEVMSSFRKELKAGKNIGILSEAGCPGIADPGQLLVGAAQDMGARVHPLVGPSSLLLALMASGMNGQRFQFIGYLPIDNQERARTIRDLEAYSARYQCTQLFIETPYRNQQMLETLLKTCQPQTRLCIAVNLTGPDEWVRTYSIAQWKNQQPVFHKQPAIFLLLAGK